MFDRNNMGDAPNFRSRFVYSSYWGTYSRIIRTNLFGFQTVEVDLTPINGDWKNQRLVNIRAHCTSRDKKDHIMGWLPDMVVFRLRQELGDELAWKLLTEDIFSQIDWDKYRLHDNGGCPLELCSKIPAPPINSRPMNWRN